MSRFARCLALVAVAACSTAPPHPAPLANLTSAASTPSIAGAYRAPHVIQVRCDTAAEGWCDENVEDQMTIRDADAGSIAVSIALVQTNAHTCTFDGTLRVAKATSGARRWTFEGHDEDGACALAIEQRTSSVQISAEGCRYYCGMRASLDAVFAFPPGSPRG